jgi:hypothetical protein
MIIPSSKDGQRIGRIRFAKERIPGVLKTQAYDFTVEDQPVDPKQCIERIVATNGTFYADCKKP